MEADDPKIMISLIILGEAKMGLKDYKQAGEYLDKALEMIRKDPHSQFYWHAVALVSRASVYDELGDPVNAEKLYDESEALYKKSLQGQYTKDYLDEFIEISLFYAKIGKPEKALRMAKEAYDYVKNSSFKNTIQEFHHVVNMAEVHYLSENYDESLKFCDEGLSMSLDMARGTNSIVDSIQIDSRKPKAILIRARSQYELSDNKDEEFLKNLLTEIENGIGILEQRRSIISSFEDINVMISENSELFNFAKKIRLDLYNLTNQKDYLADILSIHESSIYSRIRSRLDIKKNIEFADLPQSVLKREKLLKDQISVTLTEASNNPNPMKNFFEATSSWNDFLDSLKISHPRYYKMRYATVEEPLDNLQSNIAENTTVVRYMFIDRDLFAFVIDTTNLRMVPLQYETVYDHVDKLGITWTDLKETKNLLHELYLQLWKPLEAFVNSEKVIIIPDGKLFNLSFEMLTPTKIESYEELSENSLLASHSISYNYSLLLFDEARKRVDYSKNFVAFVPEFNGKMKREYQLAITDSVDLDKTYLTLLPQPFTLELAKHFTKRFEGRSFLNENASKQVFENSAKEHKIIHIGTHAENNNVSPELSRLVFAKNPSGSTQANDNYLFTYEIYNQNLSSNLAILTACETGKPTYQAGEGMISLAHAFNYAGSESMLTSLWKIDEQSSSVIIRSFYNYMSDGLSKDEALRKSKLDYIASAEGRTIAPQYWAGLVLMGDTAAIEFNRSGNWVYWLIGVLVVLILVYFLIKRYPLVK